MQGDAGATFDKEIERVIDTRSAVLFTFSIPERVACPDWQVRSKRWGLRFGVLQISISPSVRNQEVKRSLIKLEQY